jgi:drug/metabolite transporter (DMT)-like permease
MEIPEKAGFPPTLGYCVWALTLVPVALIALRLDGWRLNHDRRSLLLCTLSGLLGAGGQMILFQTLRLGPAYLVFPVISLYPALAVLLSLLFLGERASRKGSWGIGLALLAIILLAYQPPKGSPVKGYLWLLLAICSLVMWGVQGFIVISLSKKMNTGSIYFYMMATALALIPIAALMTDFSQSINWGWKGPYLTAGVQSLNSLGNLFSLFALRHGIGIIVVPLTSLAPVLTILLSLLIYGAIPHPVLIAGMAVASVSIYLLAGG